MSYPVCHNISDYSLEKKLKLQGGGGSSLLRVFRTKYSIWQAPGFWTEPKDRFSQSFD